MTLHSITLWSHQVPNRGFFYRNWAAAAVFRDEAFDRERLTLLEALGQDRKVPVLDGNQCALQRLCVRYAPLPVCGGHHLQCATADTSLLTSSLRCRGLYRLLSPRGTGKDRKAANTLATHYRGLFDV